MLVKLQVFKVGIVWICLCNEQNVWSAGFYRCSCLLPQGRISPTYPCRVSLCQVSRLKGFMPCLPPLPRTKTSKSLPCSIALADRMYFSAYQSWAGGVGLLRTA